MKDASLTAPLPVPRSRLADLVELTKPRIAVMVLFTVGAGAILAQPAAPDWLVVLHAVIGAGLLAAGASVLNQVLERGSDALMRRTENRPLPAGRLHPVEGWVLGLALGAGGFCYLWLTGRHPLAAWIGAFTFLSYVFIYTPLKRHTTLNTLIGAVPGALPPVIGWAAVTGALDLGALAVFLVIFLWQVPHFLAIAWIHREDYGRAGLQMLPVADPTGVATGRQAIIFSVALVLLPVLPAALNQASWLFAAAAGGLGLYFFVAAWRFAKAVSNPAARKLLHASLLYLPAVLVLWMVDHCW